MGVKQLFVLIQEKAPSALKEMQLELLSGKTLACDASMAIYHFIIAT
jgi:flap endonuclease-1